MNLKNLLLIAFWLCLILILQGKQLFAAFQQNIANTVIYKSFSQSSLDAASRQRSLAIAATSLGAGLFDEPETTGDLSMIPASLRGLYYHRLGDWDNASSWYGSAARGEAVPEQQKDLLISPWMELDPTGDFVLEAHTKEWHKRADTAPGAKLTWSDRGTIEFSCSEILEEPRKAVLEWNQLFDIPYHHTLILRAKAEIGTILILETAIDGQLIRHLTHNGTGKWENFTIPVEGDHVKFIYVHVREDRNSPVRSCAGEIDSISFLLD